MPAKPKVRAADVANGDVDGTSATPADAAALERACATIAEKVRCARGADFSILTSP